MTHSDLDGLLVRVREATGADRELDLALATALVPDVIVGRQRDDDSGHDPYTYWEYTDSEYAALNLVERMLPGWFWRVEKLRDEYAAEVAEWGEHPGSIGRAYFCHSAPTAPLAILAALLTAMKDHP